MVKPVTGVDDRRENCNVLPIAVRDVVEWIYSIGLAVARSARANATLTDMPAYDDFSFTTSFGVQISRTFKLIFSTGRKGLLLVWKTGIRIFAQRPDQLTGAASRWNESVK